MTETQTIENPAPEMQGVANTSPPYQLPNGQVVDEKTTTVPLKYLQTKENPRTNFNYDSNDGFDQSIKEHGVQTPVLIAVDEEGDLVVFVGGRRTRSARMHRGEDYDMPVRFMRLNADERRAAALIENSHRENPSLTEEGNHAAKLLGAFGNNRDATAKYLGWTRSKLDTRLAILALIDIAQVALNSRQISLGIAELLATLPKEKQEAVLTIVQDKKLSESQVKEWILKNAKTMANAIFDKTDCVACPHNSDLQASLFAENIGSGSCSNPGCFDKKTDEELDIRKLALADEFPTVRFINPGEQHTVIKIQADGEKGVGAEQAEACRSCADYGGVISKLPGSIGQAYKNQCFNLICHAGKVAANLAATKPVASESPSTETSKTTQNTTQATSSSTTGKSAPTSTAAPKAATTSVIESQRVKDYRVGIWRAAAKAVIRTRSKESVDILFALAMTNTLSKVDSSKIRDALGTMTGSPATKVKGIKESASLANKLDEVQRQKMPDRPGRESVGSSGSPGSRRRAPVPGARPHSPLDNQRRIFTALNQIRNRIHCQRNRPGQTPGKDFQQFDEQIKRRIHFQPDEERLLIRRHSSEGHEIPHEIKTNTQTPI
ncbi:hypothetical protein UNDKW_5913 (plasmid) [Undibacterium sp. KW1]|uniref:PRTRC system ParB family protein n=1 Tax=Undibacterium sp. KW1 TaxID=2058624 RepID=UPI001331CED2|nr:PRTRC system ParB family protein [Undibacterium sp. KW1]BBB64186.1 hypothetical protein UNDKW_5913 [Undibacterium sp. KW1]